MTKNSNKQTSYDSEKEPFSKITLVIIGVGLKVPLILLIEYIIFTFLIGQVNPIHFIPIAIKHTARELARLDCRFEKVVNLVRSYQSILSISILIITIY